MERETRVMHAVDVECRAKGDASVIEGMGALYGVETVIGNWFREVIVAGAFADTVRDDDIRVLFNHDSNYVLGRNKAGTATVTEDRKGLRYAADINQDDPEAKSVGAKIKRRDVTGSSFSFTVESDDDEEWLRDDPAKLPLRRIKRAKVFDVGPVTFPAYEPTSASARSRSRAEALTAFEAQRVEALTVNTQSRTRARIDIERARAWAQ